MLLLSHGGLCALLLPLILVGITFLWAWRIVALRSDHSPWTPGSPPLWDLSASPTILLSSLKFALLKSRAAALLQAFATLCWMVNSAGNDCCCPGGQVPAAPSPGHLP